MAIDEYSEGSCGEVNYGNGWLGDLGHCSVLCDVRVLLLERRPEARAAGTDHQYHHKSVDSCRVDSVFPGVEQMASALVGTTKLRVEYGGIALYIQRQVGSIIGGNRTECSVVVVFDQPLWSKEEQSVMDKEALYWVLSTLPQVSAALVAFIGFLALQSLDEPSRRRRQMENNCRELVKDWGEFKTLGWAEIETLSSDELMSKVRAVLKELRSETTEKGTMPAMLRDYYRGWNTADQHIRNGHLVLTVFVLFHLLVIFISLSAIPYIPCLENASWTTGATVAISILMVVTVGIMIFVALKRSAN